MIKKVIFSKMVAAGNDFLVIGNVPCAAGSATKSLVKKLCDRKYGVGADGVLLLEKSKRADVKMRIFNADGSEADMCGNGARCVALFKSPDCRQAGKAPRHRTHLTIETKAGIIESVVAGNEVKIKLTTPKDLKLNIPIKVNGRKIMVNFINTGVPHTVVFVEALEIIDVESIGRQIRYHNVFQPAGTNVNFVEVMCNHSIKVRTYERGVEAETLACGTGSTASALMYALKAGIKNPVKVVTKSQEVLTVYFSIAAAKLENVWLQGQAQLVFKGELIM